MSLSLACELIVDLAACEQEGTHAIELSVVCRDLIGGIANALYPSKLAVRLHGARQCRPAAIDGILMSFLIEHAVIDAPGESVHEERGATRLRRGMSIASEQ